MTARAHRRQTRDPQRNRQKAHPTVTTLKATVAAMIQKTAQLEVTAARNPHQSLQTTTAIVATKAVRINQLMTPMTVKRIPLKVKIRMNPQMETMSRQTRRNQMMTTRRVGKKMEIRHPHLEGNQVQAVEMNQLLTMEMNQAPHLHQTQLLLNQVKRRHRNLVCHLAQQAMVVETCRLLMQLLPNQVERHLLNRPCHLAQPMGVEAFLLSQLLLNQVERHLLNRPCRLAQQPMGVKACLQMPLLLNQAERRLLNRLCHLAQHHQPRVMAENNQLQILRPLHPATGSLDVLG
mmetsp:Transcript_15746/g.28468  ORF Transcript_15746/g.28468 Transcript_15746/m.28468 type:complete len:291 (+) Transcript_15746:243-1115(+)